MPKSLNIQDIMEMLPHRFPFLLIDRVVELSDELDRVVAIKNVTMNEPFFVGHFPNEPVMPGVLIIEALAQVGAVTMLSMPENKGKIGLFGGIKNARFRRQVTPGDVLELECTILKQKGPVAVAEAKATVGGQLAVSAELTFALAKDL